MMTSPDDGITMRTIVDLPDPERAQLDALCRQRGLSRAAALAWLQTFPRLPLDDAIILATARCAQLTLATRNSRDFPLSLGGVLHAYGI